MNKIILAITLAATAAVIVPANAQTANTRPVASSTIQAGNQCFKPTDSARGYGYWTSCDNVYAFAVIRGRSPNREVQAQIQNGSGGEGGGGGEGSGGGGGNR